jgi:hypothetical protein
MQRNAIQSWLRLSPPCEVILFGEEEGIAQVVVDLKIRHEPDLVCNEYGTPLVSDVFEKARHLGTQNLLCYVNSDIILLSDFVKAIQRIHFKRFLMVGQRWDVDLKALWDFGQPTWEALLREYVSHHGTIHPPLGSDYFVFPRNEGIEKIPPFAIGRPGWDNWLIYKARKLHIPVIDATKVVTVIHQNHDYSHILNQNGGPWDGPEANRNRALMGGYECAFTLLESTHIMTPKAVRTALVYKYPRRCWQTMSIIISRIKAFVQFLHRVGCCFRFW